MCLLRRIPKTFISNLINTKTGGYWNRVLFSTSIYDINLTIQGVPLQNYIKQLQRDYETAHQNSTRFHELQPVINILRERQTVINNLTNLKELLNDRDEGIRKLAEEEKVTFENNIKLIDEQLLDAILPSDKDDECRSIILEINAGVGGQEAMLFASELFEMYSRFAQHQGWETQIADYTTTDLGGIRHGSLLISGNDVFRYFKHEAGVHRVQRIPTTEKAGRIHTSTVSVLALPQPTEIQISIDSNDLKIETKRASGAGGQHVNTTDSAVRITHLPSGVSVECQVDRSQIKNRQIAMMKLRALLYQREKDSQFEKSQTMRRSQVKSNFRNEKIRTYNFPQDRVTDHRLQGCNVHNLKGFLQGSEALEELINKLDYQLKVDTLLSFVDNSNK